MQIGTQGNVQNALKKKRGNIKNYVTGSLTIQTSYLVGHIMYTQQRSSGTFFSRKIESKGY